MEGSGSRDRGKSLAEGRLGIRKRAAFLGFGFRVLGFGVQGVGFGGGGVL